ncbi:recombinase family protein [bacterium]|nr:recombinase family protein [bacterium]
MKAVCYGRVSIEEQAREGVSLAAQRAKIEAYCMLHDIELVSYHEDAGISGKAMDNRDGLQTCLAELRAGKANACVCWKLDRLSRSTRDVLEMSDLFQREGWALHSISEKLDTSSAAGRFVLTILAALAQMEREQIGERTSMALQFKKSRGERLGTTPFGFRTECIDGENQLVPIEEEQEIIRRMARLRSSGATFQAIADLLNDEGIPTKRSGRWHPGSVSYVLKNVLPRLENAA